MAGATIIIVTKCNNVPCIVVYKEYRKWAPNGFWSTPGGKIDYGETELDAALRETYEEAFIRFEASDLSTPIQGKNCTYFVTNKDNISRREFLIKRYKTPNLTASQKEMWNITFVPIENLFSDTRFVTDINNKPINLRDIFFRDLKRNPEILEKITQISKKLKLY